MKTSELKKLIKEATREVIQEELKEIILEAIKSSSGIIKENNSSKSPSFEVKTNLREQYKSIIGDMGKIHDSPNPEIKFNTSDIAQPFIPSGFSNTTTGQLPPGELSLDQISALMKNN